MKVKELRKEEKLQLIDEILSDWEQDGWEYYICIDISRVSLFRGFITNDKYLEIPDDTDLAAGLIPEMLDFQPEGTDRCSSWFGIPSRFGGVRTGVLRELRESILKSEGKDGPQMRRSK